MASIGTMFWTLSYVLEGLAWEKAEVGLLCRVQKVVREGTDNWGVCNGAVGPWLRQQGPLHSQRFSGYDLGIQWTFQSSVKAKAVEGLRLTVQPNLNISSSLQLLQAFI